VQCGVWAIKVSDEFQWDYLCHGGQRTNWAGVSPIGQTGSRIVWCYPHDHLRQEAMMSSINSYYPQLEDALRTRDSFVQSVRAWKVGSVYERYLNGGFVAQLLPSGVNVRRGKVRTPLWLFAAPGASPADVQTAMEQLKVKADDWSFRRSLSRFTRGFMPSGDELNQLDSAVPAGIYVTTARRWWGRGGPRVAVPIDGGRKLALYRLKPGVI